MHPIFKQQLIRYAISFMSDPLLPIPKCTASTDGRTRWFIEISLKKEDRKAEKYTEMETN